MSLAVSGTPSDHITPERMSKVQVWPSSEVSQLGRQAGSGDMSFIE